MLKEAMLQGGTAQRSLYYDLLGPCALICQMESLSICIVAYKPTCNISLTLFTIYFTSYGFDTPT